MTTELPIEAERYLANLAEGLRAMPRNERDALILELRSHFRDLADRRGSQSVIEGIAELGSAQGLANEFIAARHPGGAPIAMPDEAHLTANAPRPFTVKGAIREAIATLKGADERLRIVVAVLLGTLVLTDFMAFLATYNPAAAMPKSLVMLLRLAGISLALVSAYRIMLPGSPKPWRIDLPFAKYIGASVALLAMLVVTARAAKGAIIAAGTSAGLAASDIYIARVVAGALIILAFAFAFIRFQPWMVATATAQPGLTLGSSWRGMRGKTGALIGGLVVLVVPFFILHFGVTAFALSLSTPRYYLPLATLDGIAATLQALFTCALLVTAYRWVADQAAPEPAPFASIEPSREAVDAARRRLLDAIDERYERQMRPFRSATNA